jgi:hypothetical protein
MSSVEQFATIGKTLEEMPSPLRTALEHRISEDEKIRHLICSPAFTTGKFHFLASLLCVTDKRWLIALRQKDGSITVNESLYNSTLLVELTIILLHGQVKIDFVEGGEARAAACQFNTVMQKVYRNAVQEILHRLDENGKAEADRDWRASPILVAWPLKFRNVAILYGPQNASLLGAVHWPEVYGAFHRQVAPAAAILLTDRQIMIIAEEKPARWFQFRPDTHYGEIIIYFPLDRLANFEIHRAARFSVLELEIHKADGGEKLRIILPLEQEKALSHLMEKTLSRHSSVRDAGANPQKSPTKRGDQPIAG